MTKKEKKKKKGSSSKAGIVLAIGLIIILIPCVTLGAILLKAMKEADAPVIANRFENDLSVEISQENLTALETTLTSLTGVEKASVVLKTAQLRVNIDTRDSLTEEEIIGLMDSVYEKVNKAFPNETYFVEKGSFKNYDLFISIYNKIGGDDMIYYSLTKNSTMAEPIYELLSQPKDEDLAKELRGEVDEPEEESAEGGEGGAQ